MNDMAETTIGFLKRGDFFLLDGIKYKVGHLIEGTNSYVACVDVESKKVKKALAHNGKKGKRKLLWYVR